jgi:hypothetical protein
MWKMMVPIKAAVGMERIQAQTMRWVMPQRTAVRRRESAYADDGAGDGVRSRGNRRYKNPGIVQLPPEELCGQKSLAKLGRQGRQRRL